MSDHRQSRHLHITIHEGSDRSAGSRPGGHSLGGSDPKPPAISVPPPDDPSKPLVSVPPPDDPSKPLVSIPPPDDPSLRTPWLRSAACVPDASWAAVRATVQEGPPTPSCCCGSDKASNRASTAERDDWSGFVILRLAAGKRSQTAESLWRLAHELNLPGLASVLRLGFADDPWGPGPHEDPPAEESYPPTVLDSWPLIDSGPCTRAQVIKAIDQAEKVARRTNLAPLYSLVSYWRVDARRHAERIPELIARFQELAEVDLAYAEITATDPSFESDQEYFERGPVGFGVRAAWRHLGPNASSVQVCDLEQAWHLDHRDFLDQNDQSVLDPPLVGANRNDKEESQGSHGTAVIGELGAIGNAGNASGDKRIVGAASAFGKFLLASHYRGIDPEDPHPLEDTNGHVASAITYAAILNNSPLAAGDILLLEVQRGGKPTEIADPADRDAIRLAAAGGVIVVEAAGNGGVDLDHYRNPHSGRSLNPRDPSFVDSGAILVGAAAAELPHDRKDFSCFGARVDCYAWGERVTTSGYGDLYGENETEFYTDTFSGTSSASPMIAGAAAILQALCGSIDGKLLPVRMREVLSDPRTGTPQGPNVPGAIGVMPDLGEILPRRLQLIENSYLRRNPEDDGSSEVATGSLSSSPDIVIQEGKHSSAVLELGEGPQAHDPAPGEPVNSTRFLNQSTDLNLYLRLRNRGAVPGNARVMLFTSPAATLITSERWFPTTEVDVDDIPVGGTLRVSSETPFNSLAGLDLDPLKPPPSWLAVYRTAKSMSDPSLFTPWPHPLPPAPPYFRFREFLQFLRGPGVAWRNVHPVEVDPQATAATITLPFLFAGTPDRSRTFDFEIEQRLPVGVELTLGVTSEALRSKLVRKRPDLPKEGSLELKGRRTDLPGVRISPDPAEDLGKATFQIKGPLSTGHSLSIRQVWRGIEVGRITWWFRKASP